MADHPTLFIDTWGWVAIHNKREPRHQEVNAFFNFFCSQQGIAHTTDYVLDETFTILFKRLSFVQAQRTMIVIDEAIQAGYLCLETITSERFENAKKLRLKFWDKPQISFTDITSMITMLDSNINQVLTEDAHFTHIGFGFYLVP